MRSIPIQFSGVIIWQSDDPLAVVPQGREQWSFSLVKDEHPQIAADEIQFQVRDGRTSKSPSWITLSLQSSLVKTQLTNQFSDGRLKDLAEFPKRLLTILKNAHYTAKAGDFTGFSQSGRGRITNQGGDFTPVQAQQKFDYYLPALVDALTRILNGEGKAAEITKIVALVPGLSNTETEPIQTYLGPQVLARAQSKVKLKKSWFGSG